MAKLITPSEAQRQKRDATIIDLGQAYKASGKYATKLDLYLAIARTVGCSHITVYRVLRRAAI